MYGKLRSSALVATTLLSGVLPGQESERQLGDPPARAAQVQDPRQEKLTPNQKRAKILLAAVGLTPEYKFSKNFSAALFEGSLVDLSRLAKTFDRWEKLNTFEIVLGKQLVKRYLTDSKVREHYTELIEGMISAHESTELKVKAGVTFGGARVATEHGSELKSDWEPESEDIILVKADFGGQQLFFSKDDGELVVVLPGRAQGRGEAERSYRAEFKDWSKESLQNAAVSALDKYGVWDGQEEFSKRVRPEELELLRKGLAALKSDDKLETLSDIIDDVTRPADLDSLSLAFLKRW